MKTTIEFTELSDDELAQVSGGGDDVIFGGGGEGGFEGTDTPCGIMYDAETCFYVRYKQIF